MYQTQYNLDSSLAVSPGQEFASRYSDPTHPANSGSLISLLTGGKINTREGKDRRRAQRAEWRGRPLKKKEGVVKRILKQVSDPKQVALNRDK